MADYLKIFEILDIPIPNSEEHLQLFEIALIHKSYLPEEKRTDLNLHYDRLEFLGDSVLKIVINQHLFDTFPHYNSGGLTKLSSYLVSDKTLKTIAELLEISPFIQHGPRAKTSSMLGDVMESLFGAVYLSFGMDKCEELILKLYKDEILKADKNRLKDNYKAALQEYLQGKGIPLPTYKVTKRTGPDNNPTFWIEVKIGDIVGVGKGSSKKDASQAAAKEAYTKLKKS